MHGPAWLEFDADSCAQSSATRTDRRVVLMKHTARTCRFEDSNCRTAVRSNIQRECAVATQLADRTQVFARIDMVEPRHRNIPWCRGAARGVISRRRRGRDRKRRRGRSRRRRRRMRRRGSSSTRKRNGQHRRRRDRHKRRRRGKKRQDRRKKIKPLPLPLQPRVSRHRPRPLPLRQS